MGFEFWTVLLVSMLNLSIISTTPAFVDSPLALPFTHSGQGEEDEWEDDWIFSSPSDDESETVSLIQLNNYCTVDDGFNTLTCTGIQSKADLPRNQFSFESIRKATFLNISIMNSYISVQDIYHLFPGLEILNIIQSPKMAQEFLKYVWTDSSSKFASRRGSGENLNQDSNENPNFVWPSIRTLNLAGNGLQSENFPFTLAKVFPNLRALNLQRNNLMVLPSFPQNLAKLNFVDLSENPLDCTSDSLALIERPNITLLHVENTFCEKPPHQNKPKPILQTLRLIKKVKAECRVNCSCEIDYIWEQDKVIKSKTAVNCSNRGFYDFPDPLNLPNPTDTLYLNFNKIHSMQKFAEAYERKGIRNLYLENNVISNINVLEMTDWIYNFQVLSLRNNNLTEIPNHILDNIMRENKWIYLIDLSLNNWKCDCRTISTFQVWLLKHAKIVKNLDDVRCERTKKRIHNLKREDWCKTEEVSSMIEFLDVLSIFIGCCIVLVIAKVSYDYWNFKHYGKVPWLVTKM